MRWIRHAKDEVTYKQWVDRIDPVCLGSVSFLVLDSIVDRGRYRAEDMRRSSTLDCQGHASRYITGSLPGDIYPEATGGRNLKLNVCPSLDLDVTRNDNQGRQDRILRHRDR
jgi:hypothetical protein